MIFALAALTFTAADIEVDPRITAASLFKNGYSVVMREFDVKGAGTYAMKNIPHAALGTYWITASEGIKIAEVVNTTETKDTSRDAGTLDEILQANVGRRILVGFVSGDDVSTKRADGILKSANGQIIVLESESGTLAISKNQVSSISAAQGQLLYKVAGKESFRVLKFKVSSNANGKIYTVGLERGMTWAPSYAIDITNEKELSFVAKSTVLNDLSDINNVELKFVTGFPNVPWAMILEPILTAQAVDQFTGMLNQAGMPAGGFGGGGRRESVMTQNAAPAADMMAAFDPSTLPGMMNEDLFFYRQPNVSLKKGDRALYVLFEMKSTYEHIYGVEIPDQVANNIDYQPRDTVPFDVWHEIKFKNNAKQPLTTAPATFFKNGETIGQDTIMYTPVGAELSPKISKSLDIRVENVEEELTRERQSIKIPERGLYYDLITVKGTVDIKSFKGDDVKMRIRKYFTGELKESTGEPKMTKTNKGIREMNPSGRLEWTPTVPAGKTLTLTYTYTLYVRSQ